MIRFLNLIRLWVGVFSACRTLPRILLRYHLLKVKLENVVRVEMEKAMIVMIKRLLVLNEASSPER